MCVCVCVYECVCVCVGCVNMCVMCMGVCMMASTCVCVQCGLVVVSLAQGLRSQSSSPSLAIFHLPPTSPPSCDWVRGIFWGTNSKVSSHEIAMVQVGLRVPTPLAVRKGLFSYKFVARLQELCLHGSQCLLSVQASWLC